MTAPPPYPPGPLGPPQPSPRNRGTRRLLIVVGAVLSVCCAGMVTGGVLLWRSVDSATKPARQVADAFVTDLQDGRTADAYGLLCREARDAYTVDQFGQLVRGRPHIAAHRFLGASTQTVNGADSAGVTMELTQTGGTERYTFLLVKEGAQWRVCGSPY